MDKCFKLYISFLKFGAFAFGGGLAMLPLMKHELVTKYKLTTEEDIINMYAISQFAPGIIAVNTSIYVGYHVARFKGLICALLGQITAPVLLMTLIAVLMQNLEVNEIFLSALSGISIMICVLMLNTVYSMGKKSYIDKFCVLLGVISLLLCGFELLPTIIVTLAAGIIGIIKKAREMK